MSRHNTPPTNKSLLFTAYCLLLTVCLFIPATALAQEPVPDLPADADAAAGAIIYQSRCATCHGSVGLGDGELAAQSVNPPTAIGSPDYLATADPELMFETIRSGRLEAGMPGFGEGNNSNPLSEDEIWDVLAAVYELPTFNEPLDTAVVSGQVNNATTGEIVGGGTALLEAYEPGFQQMLTLESPVSADGVFQFDLQSVPPQWFYRVIVGYDGLEFSSDFGQLSAAAPELDLPVDVYDQTSDPAVLRIQQLDVIVEFVGDNVRFNQVYVVDNVAPAVFVGDSGDFEAGTFTVALPRAAENINFLRGIGSGAADFAPAAERMTQLNETDWAVRLPIASGTGALRLLVRYELPYQRGVTLAHPLYYPTSVASVVLQDDSIEVTDDVWNENIEEGPQFVRYQRPPLGLGEMLEITLQGSPATVTDTQGNLVVYRNEQQELMVGLVSLAAVLVGAGWLAYRWLHETPAENEQDTLLRTLAALDETYTAGKIRKSSYERQREQIKSRLMAIWESGS
ncbi:MAG: c-type cytochrome [Anaerolineales bacterium]|nr:c-type cytochrome [Anaerolineales bacterium]